MLGGTPGFLFRTKAVEGRGRGAERSRGEQGMEQASSSARILACFDREVVEPLRDFQDPSQEWRRLFSELLGTFFLVLVAADAPGRG